MNIFCRPLIALPVLVLLIAFVLLYPTLWQSRAQDDEGAENYDSGKWVLIGLSLVAVISMGVFLIFAFTGASGFLGLGC
jgi:uncharacterized membrane protein